MEEANKEKLRQNRVFIIENVDYEDISDHLIQDKVVTSDKNESIKWEKTKRDKIRRFLDEFPRLGAQAYPCFIKALKQCEQDYSHVLKVLDEYDEVENMETAACNFVGEPMKSMPLFANQNLIPSARKNDGFIAENVHHAHGDYSMNSKGSSDITRNMNWLGLKESPSDSSLKSNKKSFLDDLEDRYPGCKKLLVNRVLIGMLSSASVPQIDTLGQCLDVDLGKIQQIKNSHPHSIQTQLVELFNHWMQLKGKKATLEKLVKAYKNAGVTESSYRNVVEKYFEEKSDDEDSADENDSDEDVT